MIQNFVSLVLLQGVNYVLPLLTYPFLFRVLEVERWGTVSFGYVLIQYFVIFTDFGFNLSATKYISCHRDDLNTINRYLNSAFICRFLLAVVSFIILFLLTASFEKFREERVFYFSYFGIVVGNILFPMWYFQGMEKMKYITLFNMVAKSASLLPFFIFIRKPQDYLLVPMFYSIGYILAGLISVYFIYFKEKMKWFLPSFSEVQAAFKDSFSYFLSRLSVSMFTNINTFILKLVCGDTAVGYYSAAEKLYQAYNQLLTPFSGVLFPYMAKTRDVAFFKKIFKTAIPLNIVLLAGILVLSFWIIQLVYGKAAEVETLSVFRTLMCACFFTIPSMLLGYPFLAAMGHASYTNWTIMIVSVVHLSGLAILFFTGLLSIYTVAGMVVLAELLLLGFRIKGVVNYKLFQYE
jgi:PST family polysaccharide transporter